MSVSVLVANNRSQGIDDKTSAAQLSEIACQKVSEQKILDSFPHRGADRESPALGGAGFEAEIFHELLRGARCAL